MDSQLEVVVDESNGCGEGPIWDFRCGTMLWDDLAASLVFELDAERISARVLSRDIMVAGIALNGRHDYVFAGAGGLHLWSRAGGACTLASEHEGEPLAINDIVAAPGGRVFAGTMHWNADGMERPGKLYRFDPDGAITIVDEGILLANGMAFSTDNHTFYLTDSAAREIYAYDFDAGSGSLSYKRVLVTVPDHEGIPDGLTIDAEDHLWSAQWYGSQVVRYDAHGAVERRIEVPAKQVSSVGFGGPDLDELYITTAGDSEATPMMPPDYDWKNGPFGGALYRIRPGIHGKPEHAADLRWPQ